MLFRSGVEVRGDESTDRTTRRPARPIRQSDAQETKPATWTTFLRFLPHRGFLPSITLVLWTFALVPLEMAPHRRSQNSAVLRVRWQHRTVAILCDTVQMRPKTISGRRAFQNRFQTFSCSPSSSRQPTTSAWARSSTSWFSLAESTAPERSSS